MRFSLSERDLALDRLEAERFDVVVVGGGITGAGVALDAASRGLRVALVERDDFASGTSSRSSKLAHGGLRYLNQREFRLVYEALHERQRLLRLAPHLVRPLPFLIPIFGGGSNRKAGARAYARAVGAALWMYDATGGARIGKLHQRLSQAETLEHMPDLDGERLTAGFLYYDARVDDARLTLAVVKTAVAEGAVAVNYAEAAHLRREGGRITGVDVLDRRLGRTVAVRAGAVVVAAGVWADEVAALDRGSEAEAAGPSIRPAKGVHITLPGGRPRLDVAAVLPSPGDRRSVFVIPWADRVYVGTTDTDYDGTLLDPVCTAADVDYLLAAVNTWIGRPVASSEVLGTWAGLRPLVKSAAPGKTADMSRRHSVRTSPAGLVSVVGGKLTTYRKMAEDAVDAASAVLGVTPILSRTASLPISGALGFEELSGDDAGVRLGLPADVATHLAGRYGGQARAVAELVRETPGLARPLVPGLPYLRAEAVYAARYEMALTLEDVLSRRTRSLLLDSAAAASAAADVAGLLAPELGWSDTDLAAQVESFRAHVAYHRHAADPASAAADARALAGPADNPGDGTP